MNGINIRDYNPEDFTPDVALLHIGRLIAGLEQAREGMKGQIEYMEAAPSFGTEPKVDYAVAMMNRELTALDQMYENAVANFKFVYEREVNRE